MLAIAVYPDAILQIVRDIESPGMRGDTLPACEALWEASHRFESDEVPK